MLIDLRVVGCSNAFGQFSQTRGVFADVRALRSRFNQIRAFKRFGGQVLQSQLRISW